MSQNLLAGISLDPKFIFGVNGSIPDCLAIYDVKRLLYVAGHNVVIYNPDEGNMNFISGTEGALRINAISLSPSNRFLAICEVGEKTGLCTIVDVGQRKRIITLPEKYIKSPEILGAVFSPKNDKRHILTLVGEPEFAVLFWDYEKFVVRQRVELKVNIEGIRTDFKNFSF